MSETNEQRNAAVFQAMTAFAAVQNVANRDALLAAWAARNAPRFYVIGDRIFLFRNGAERPVADCAAAAIAQAITDRLNTDLDNGWIPSLP